MSLGRGAGRSVGVAVDYPHIVGTPSEQDEQQRTGLEDAGKEGTTGGAVLP